MKFKVTSVQHCKYENTLEIDSLEELRLFALKLDRDQGGPVCFDPRELVLVFKDNSDLPSEIIIYDGYRE